MPEQPASGGALPNSAPVVPAGERTSEDLVLAVSTSFINLDHDQVDDAIERALARVGRFAGADRSYIFRMDSFDPPTCSNTHEWCAESVSPQKHMLQRLVNDGFPVTSGTLIEGRSYCRHDLTELPAEEEAEWKELVEQGLRAILSVPMWMRGRLTGFIGLDWHESRKIDEDTLVPLLRFVGEAIDQALHRKNTSRLLADHRQRLRSLASELSLAEERERRRLATCLHDDLGQTLSMAKIKLGLLRRDTTSEPGETLDEVVTMLDDCLASTRNLIFELSPPVLYDVGLRAAVNWLSGQLREMHGLEVEITEEGERLPLSDEMKSELFKAIRELLNNVVKHAGAAHAGVSFSRSGDDIAVVVTDDGTGFDADALSRGRETDGFGLFSIRERLGYLGGSLILESSRAAGTRAVLRAPLSDGGPHDMNEGT